MSALTFDTHKAVEYLLQKGISKEHAEGIIETLQQSREFDSNMLITKDYLDAKLESMESKFDARFTSMESKFDVKLNKVKYEVVVWLIGCTFAIISAMSYFKI